jgi:hypothetical protein
VGAPVSYGLISSFNYKKWHCENVTIENLSVYCRNIYNSSCWFWSELIRLNIFLLFEDCYSSAFSTGIVKQNFQICNLRQNLLLLMKLFWNRVIVISKKTFWQIENQLINNPLGAKWLIISMKHLLMCVYQVCSNKSPGVKIGPAPGGSFLFSPLCI